MNYRRIALPIAIVLAAFLSGGWLLQRGSSEQSGVYQKARLFEEVLNRVASYYVDSLSEQQLYDLAIDGMLLQLGDPYTGFLRAEDFEDLAVSTTGNYGGLGVRIEVSDGWVTVVTPLADTPAERAGMLAGDRIVEVEGESTAGWSIERAASVLRGEPGSSVNMRVARPGISEPLKFNIDRARIHVTSVRYARVFEPEIGYVQLETVSEESASELAEAVDQLSADGARALILDLRFNPGGILHQGVAVADLFLDKGDEVVSTRGRAPNSTRTFDASRPERWADMPVVVLVNEFTASAAEIIAGALQDHDRALILGTPTFGKGLVQSVFQFGRNQALKLTTGRWYTPSGRSIQRTSGDDDLRDSGAIALGVGGDSTHTAADSAGFLSTGGRALLGDGGIHPDIAVTPDTLTDAGRDFAEQLGADVQAFRDVMGGYARELKASGAVTDVDFQVSDAIRAELLARIRSRGIAMPGGIWSGVQDLVDREFSYQVLRVAFGRSAEMARRTNDDQLVLEALELLREAESIDALFSLVERVREGEAPSIP
jgi:carboxyl-terminal processing protease